MTILSPWDFGSRGAAEAAVVALQGLCLSELMFAIPDPNGLPVPEIRQLAQRLNLRFPGTPEYATVCDAEGRRRAVRGAAASMVEP